MLGSIYIFFEFDVFGLGVGEMKPDEHEPTRILWVILILIKSLMKMIFIEAMRVKISKF